MFSIRGIYGKIILGFGVILLVFMILSALFIGISSASNTKSLVKDAREYIKITGNTEVKEIYERVEKEQKVEMLSSIKDYLIRDKQQNLGMEDEISLDKIGTYEKAIYIIVENNTSKKSDISDLISNYLEQNTGIPLQIINKDNEDEVATFNGYYSKLEGASDLDKLLGVYIKGGKIQKEYNNVEDLSNLPII